MIERIVERILLSKFQNIFYGIAHKNIHVGILSGHFTIQNIGLQPYFFNYLNLPIMLNYSFVEKLSVSYPWRESNTNLVINIENIYAILTPKAESDFNFTEMLWKNKEEIIKSAIKEFLNKEKEEKKKTRERTGFENTLFRLLDNIEIRIKHIHIRFEHNTLGYSFGLTIHEILAETRDAQGNRYYFDRQKAQEKYVSQVLQVNRIGFYWNSTQSHMLNKLPIAQITNQMYNLSVSHLFMDDLLPVNFSRHNQPRLRYLININMSCCLKKYLTADDYQNPQYSCQVNFHQIQCRITHDQYSQMIQLVQSFLAYQAQWKTIQQMNELQNYKLKSGREILNMMRAKRYTHQGDQSQYTSKYVQSYLSWVFRSVRERYIMKKFILLAIQKPITFENIMKSGELRRIIGKTEGERIKQWLQIALRFKIDYESEIAKVNIDRQEYLHLKLEGTLQQAYKGSQKRDRKVVASMSQLPDPSSSDSPADQHHYIWFKLRVNIESGKFEISKGEFGLEFGWNGLHAQLNLRKVNFFVQISMNDFFVKLFDHWGSGGRAYVDLLKKTTTFEFGEQPRLLAIRFQKNPIAKPFVFTETQLELRSIEFTAFPSSLKKLYQILSQGVTKKKPSQQQHQKPQNLKTDRDNYGQTAIKAFGFQTNSISAKVHSPWIIIPFSKVNDRKSQCWVVRLGDFSVRPPLDIDVFQPKDNDEEEELYYDRYQMTLENFELKYFSSIYYFYSSMKFGASQKMAHLLTSPLMQQGNAINVIKPFSCQLKIKILKKYLSQSIKQSHHQLKSNLQIGSIQVHLSSLVLAKLKTLMQQFKKDDNPQFLQQSKQDILQGATLKGTLNVHYKNFQNMRFYGVMAGCQLYLFASENSEYHQLQLNLQELQVRLMDTEHLAARRVMNPEAKEVLELYFQSGVEMGKWEKHIEKSYEVKAKTVKPKASKDEEQSVLNQTKSKKNIEEAHMKKQSKYKLGMTIRSLQLLLYDEQQQFLSCLMTNLVFHLVQNIHRGMDLSVQHIHLSQPTHKVKVLLSSDLMQPSTSRSNSPAKRFLDMNLLYDEIGALREINFKFQDILLVFKVNVIQKIMSFFFLESTNPTVPPPPNKKKMTIEMILEIDNLHLVCVHQEHIAGIIKAEKMKFIYRSTSTQENFTFGTKKLEAANYQNNDITKQYTLFKARQGRQQVFQLIYSVGQILQPSELNSPLKNGGRRSQSRISNLGLDVISPILDMSITGYQLSYQHQQFMRLFNYAISKFIGALSSKFKVKKQYTDDYIYETWKTKTTAILKIEIKDCVLKVRDVPESDEYLRFQVPYVLIHRNLDQSFEPELGTVNSKKGPMRLLYEKIVIEPKNVDVYYVHEKRHERIKVNNNRPLSLQLQYNKWNLPKEYFPVLRSIDDIDRTVTLIVSIKDGIDLNLQKIVFYMILKMYYRNIKQKDGLAEIFQPPTSFATPKEYKIRVPAITIRLSQEIDLMFKQFAVIHMPNFRLDARQVRTLINFTIKGDNLTVKYQDSISSDTILQAYRQQHPPIFKVDMQSDHGVISSDIILKNYRAHLDINQIDALVDYFDFDAADVQNKKMPKKSAKSFQNFRISWRDGLACLISGEDVVSVSGLVFVSLSKNPGSQWDGELRGWLGEGVQPADVNQKELKVNAENLSVFLNSIKLTEVPNFLYTRNQFSARKVVRRHRREHILLQHFQLCCFANIVSKLQKLYKQRIKKVKVKKSYFDPAAGIPAKKKYNQKRILNIQGEPIGIVLLHHFQQQIYPAIKLLVDFRKLTILMMTSVVKQVSTIFDLKVFNCSENFDFTQILDAKNMVLTFDSDQGQKKVLILQNVLNFDTYNVNQSVVNRLVQSRSQLLKPTIPQRSPVKLINDTECQLGVQINVTGKSLFSQTLKKYQTKVLMISHYSLCRMFGQSAHIRVALLEESVEANIPLSTIDCKKLINLENRYYVSLGVDGGLSIRMMSQFKLENRTALRLRYRVKDGKVAGKNMAVIEPKANASLNFRKGTQLLIYDEAAQEDTLISYGDGFEKRTNFNFRLKLSTTSMSTLILSPKIQLLNLLPTKLMISHHKFFLEVNTFQTAQVLQSSFKAKKQVTLTIGQDKFKCPTQLFIMQSNKPGCSLLQLSSSDGQLQYCLQFQRQFKDDSTRWTIKPQLIILNLTGDLLQFSRKQMTLSLTPNSTCICNKSDTLTFHKPTQFKLKLSAIKPGQQQQVKDIIISYAMLEKQGGKVPTVIIQSEVSLINETKYPLVFGNSPMPLEPQSECPASGSGNQLRISMGVDERMISFQRNKEVYCFLKRKATNGEFVNVLLKVEMVNIQKRKLIKIVEESSPSKYWIKNNAKGFTLTVKQLFQGANQQFTVPEGSERGVSLEDPMATDEFEIEFYYNLKNIEFNKRAVFNPATLPQLTYLELNEQGVNFKFKLTFARGSTSYTLTIDPIEGNTLQPQTSFQVDMKRMLFNLRFSSKQTDHRNLCVQILQLYFKLIKRPPMTIYQLFLQDLSAQYKRSLVLSRTSNQPLLDLTLILDKSRAITRIQNAKIAPASIAINIHQEFLFETASFLKKFDLLSDKKKAFKTQRRKYVVELIRTGSKGQLASLHELEIAQGRKDRPKEEKQLLVGLFRLQGCTFNLSYLKGETFNVNEFRHHNILKYLTVIPNLKQMKVQLGDLTIQKFEGTEKTFKKKLTSHFKKTIPSTVSSSISSLSVFENPVEAISTITSVVNGIWSIT